MEGVAKKRTSFGRRTKSYESVNRVVESYFQQIIWDDSKLKESKLMIVSKNIYNDLDEITDLYKIEYR